MRGVRVALVVAGIGLGSAAACVDFDSLQVSDPAPDPGDGGPPDTETPPTDAEPTDAGADGSWCQTHPGHSFCFDFDTVGVPEVGFSDRTVSGGSGGGVVALDTSVFRSPPASFSSRITNGSTFGGTYAVVSKAITPHPAKLTVGFDLHTSAPTGDGFDGGAAFMAIQDVATDQDGGAVFYSTSLGITGGAPGLVVHTSYPSTAARLVEDDKPTSPLGSDWTRVVITITFGPPQHVNVTFDGILQVDHTFLDSQAVSNGSVRVSFGVIAERGGPLQGNYDNITIDAQ